MSRPDRIPSELLTPNDLTGLYDDLDQYGEAISRMNETIIKLNRQLAKVRALHEENCPVIRLNLAKSFSCSLCDALTPSTWHTT